MATSSIFSDVKITESESANKFLLALYAAEKKETVIDESSIVPSLTKEELKKILAQKKVDESCKHH